MRLKATSAAKKLDLRDFCGHLDLRATSEIESELLALMHNVFVAGGTITVAPSREAKKMNSRIKGKFIYGVPSS
jgi:hypothetical protein